MRSLGRVNASEADVYLTYQLALMTYMRTLDVQTVLFFNNLFSSGIFLPGAHPQPASRPPGVWKRWKLSASPTRVTVPNKLLFLKNPGRM